MMAPIADQGLFRQCPPEETVARMQPILGVMGITRVANVTGLDRVGIPVVMVCRPNARSVAVAQGKGVSMVAAKASGLMESIESYHAERFAGPLWSGSLEELRYDRRVADVARLPKRRGASFTPFDRTLWSEGFDLLNDNAPTLVPHSVVHLDYSAGSIPWDATFATNSNGLASGNSQLEAIGHGICEVIERDSTTLWHLAGVEVQADTGIDLTTIDDPVSRGLIARFHDAGLSIGVWETTSDIGVPSFLCRIIAAASHDSHSARPATGMGCHPNREAALQRALTEAAQSRLTFISGARDDLFRSDYDRLLCPAGFAPWRESMTLTNSRRDFGDVRTWDGHRLDHAVDWLLQQLRSVGIQQVIAVDLSKSEFDVPVVRIVIPGLEGIDDVNYVPGPRASRLLSGTA